MLLHWLILLRGGACVFDWCAGNGEALIQASSLANFAEERSSKSLLANVLDIDDDFRAHTLPHTHTTNNTAGFIRVPHGGHSVDDSHLVHTCMSSCTRELNLILKEIRVITDKMRKNDEEGEVFLSSGSRDVSHPSPSFLLPITTPFQMATRDLFNPPFTSSGHDASISAKGPANFRAQLLLWLTKRMMNDAIGLSTELKKPSDILPSAA
ncbi:Neuronal acetylcholine receptor subunit alpha-7 [Halocaridina rubra]|uniref:Neuronal acetylcholine receptor subunit alpha-7 n=1 Tax=Halocaridina rubra TaxID=373956 RepID=A0AAN9AGX2_HALRR